MLLVVALALEGGDCTSGRAAPDGGKVEAFIEKVENNIQANRDRQASAYSSDFADRVGEWIQEDEEKLEDARHSLEELNTKIEQAEERLRNS